MATEKNYPSGIDSFQVWIDDVDIIYASTINDIQEQIVTIETELGTEVAGTMTDLKTRLAVAINNDGTLKESAIGATGIQGVTGIQGQTGIQGIQGNTGIDGNQGNTGLSGSQGNTGVQGIQGETGVEGIQGQQGETGLQGNTGIQGLQGQTGIQGIQGQTGPQGPSGTQKKTISITSADGTFSFDFTNEGLVDYLDTNYKVSLTPFGVNSINCWPVISSDKTTTGFTISLRTSGLNGSGSYDASVNNVSVDVIITQ